MYPQIPEGITWYSQKEPIRFGSKKIRISVNNGGGEITSVRVNGNMLELSSPNSVVLPYDLLPEDADVEITIGQGTSKPSSKSMKVEPARNKTLEVNIPDDVASRISRLKDIVDYLWNHEHAAKFAMETLRAWEVYMERRARHLSGAYPEFADEKKADVLKMYESAAIKMWDGFVNLMEAYANGKDPETREIASTWNKLAAQ